MKRLSKKLHSERGVSLLLAMLMLLVCMMVAASILAAAASNAGKYRSNRTEQQKYLTLSSAIQLIADEIQHVDSRYTGKYKLYEWSVVTPDVTDTEGNIIIPGRTDYYFHIQQERGEFVCGDLADTTAVSPVEILPLRDELDDIFSSQFTGKGSGYSVGDSVEKKDQEKHTLTVSLPTGLDGYPYPAASDPAASDKLKTYEVPKDVTVQVELNHATKHIALTAWLGTKELDANGLPKDKSDTMIAELVVKDLPVLDYSPGGRMASALTGESGTGSPKEAPEMTWELNWIKKGVA